MNDVRLLVGEGVKICECHLLNVAELANLYFNAIKELKGNAKKAWPTWCPKQHNTEYLVKLVAFGQKSTMSMGIIRRNFIYPSEEAYLSLYIRIELIWNMQILFGIHTEWD